MREFKKGKLNIGKSKKKVKNRKQAIAIALNEAGIKQKKVSKVMREFKKGKLNIGKSNKKVKNRKQAVAIALNEAGIKQKRRRT